MKNIIYILIILILITSCSSHKGATTTTPSPYQRKPIVEVTEAQLKTEAQQIDATTQLLIGKPQEAVNSYLAILKDNPSYAPAHYELGKIYLAVGWLDSALYHSQQAFRSQSDNLWYELQLTQIYERQQDTKNLIATWEDIVKRNPDRPDLYYDLSNAYLLSNNVVASIEALDRVERRFGITEPVSLQKQKLWSAINKPEKARKELEKLAEAMPTENRYNAILAESYMAEKNYNKALQYYNRILQNNPSDENIHISMASCYQAMGDPVNTYRHVRLGVLNPEISCTDRLTYLIEFLHNKGFFTAFSKPCYLLADTIAQQCQGESDHAFLYGQLLAAQERYAEAAAQFSIKLQSNKSRYEIWEALLACESMTSDTNAALLDHASQAAELFPLHLTPYLILTQGYFKLGDCGKAKQYLDRCLMVAPNDNRVKELKQSIQQTCE